VALHQAHYREQDAPTLQTAIEIRETGPQAIFQARRRDCLREHAPVEPSRERAAPVVSRADLERRGWPESNLSKLLGRLKLHHAELFPVAPGSMKITHTALCSSKKSFGRCSCTVKVRIGQQEFVGG